MSEREEILSAVRSGATLASSAPLTTEPGYIPPLESDLWAVFESNLRELGGKMVDREEARRLAEKPRWVDADAEALTGSKTDVDKIWEAEVGFSVAKCAIAQTGTLVFESGPGSYRLTTLIPPMSVVFVPKESILPTLVEALEFVSRSEKTCVFVTGPSRTADIEGVLVRGVHGPGELLVCVV